MAEDSIHRIVSSSYIYTDITFTIMNLEHIDYILIFNVSFDQPLHLCSENTFPWKAFCHCASSDVCLQKILTTAAIQTKHMSFGHRHPSLKRYSSSSPSYIQLTCTRYMHFSSRICNPTSLPLQTISGKS